MKTTSPQRVVEKRSPFALPEDPTQCIHVDGWFDRIPCFTTRDNTRTGITHGWMCGVHYNGYDDAVWNRQAVQGALIEQTLRTARDRERAAEPDAETIRNIINTEARELAKLTRVVVRAGRDFIVLGESKV